MNTEHQLAEILLKRNKRAPSKIILSSQWFTGITIGKTETLRNLWMLPDMLYLGSLYTVYIN
jgi:hypothetical protein